MNAATFFRSIAGLAVAVYRLIGLLYYLPHLYQGHHDRFLESTSAPRELGCQWQGLVTQLQHQWIIFKCCSGLYIMVVFGLLQVSGTTPGILVVTTGTVCVIFSVTAVLYCEAFNAYLARADRYHSGWISFGVPDAEWSWRSVPMLLAVPAAHVCWATAVFIAFVMVEAWTGMGAQCANMSGDPSLSTRNIHIGGTTVICALVVTGQIVASVVQAAFVVPAFRQLCSSSEQTTDTV